MADLVDYLDWRGDLPFTQVPPGPVDGLIFAALSYLDLSGLVPDGFQNPVTLRDTAAAVEAEADPLARTRVREDRRLLQKAGASERFGGTELFYYQNEFLPEEESQFAAVAFRLSDGTAVLSFRGTDDTLVGWKEDFNMSFQARVPAQEKALYYTEAFAAVHDCPLILCGHSKGGNLAVFAAAQCRPGVQERLRATWNYDGPGFTSAMMGDPGYRAVVPKIHTFVPESSVIGMLLEHEEPYRVVRSRQISIMQHELYSWEVLGGGFVETDRVDDGARNLNLAIKTWLAEKTLQERNAFVDAVYELLSQSSAEKTSQLILPRNVLSYLRTLTGDDEMRALLRTEFGSFFQSVLRSRKKQESPQLSAGTPQS